MSPLPEPDPFFADPDERGASSRTRGGRVIGSHAMPRQKRPSAPTAVIGTAQRAGRQQEPAGRGGLTSLAAELAGAGVAGINLEDVSAGGALRDPAAQTRIIRAVRAAAPDLFLNARTDVYWLGYGPAANMMLSPSTVTFTGTSVARPGNLIVQPDVFAVAVNT